MDCQGQSVYNYLQYLSWVDISVSAPTIRPQTIRKVSRLKMEALEARAERIEAQEANAERGVRAATCKKLVEISRLPSRNELGDNTTCSICHEALFSGEDSEIPMALPCGHVFGYVCIMTWFSGSWDPTNRILSTPNTCPVCRSKTLREQDLEEISTRAEYEQCLQNAPRKGWNMRFSEEENQWAERAEEIWKICCRDLVRYHCDITDSRGWRGSYKFDARRIIHFVTLESFARHRQQFSHPDYAASFPSSYRLLCEHLDNAVGSGTFLVPNEEMLIFMADCMRQLQGTWERVRNQLEASIAQQAQANAQGRPRASTPD